MKKFYIIALCAATLASAVPAVGATRFKSKSARKSIKREAASPNWKPSYEKLYLYEDGEWIYIGETKFEYDSKGNVAKETLDEDGWSSENLYTWNEYGQKVLVETFDEGEASSKTTYEYDPVVHDFITLRMGYDFDGSKWVENYMCESNIVTRNADGNITEIVKSLPYSSEKLVPAYRAVWGYDGGAESPAQFDYYANYSGDDPASWDLYDGCSYRNIVWESFDGQPTESDITEYVEGPNRIKSCVVYYDDELDGYYFAEFSGEKDYTIRETYSDPTVTAISRVYVTTDENGSYTFEESEFFDDNGDPTEEAYYTFKMVSTCDEHGNEVSVEAYESIDGFSELVEGYKSNYTYDADGNVTMVETSYYDWDEDEYLPDMKYEYGDYVNTSGVAGMAVSAKALRFVAGSVVLPQGVKNATVYTLQGAKVAELKGAGAHNLGNLAKGIYIIKAEGNVLKVRI